MTAVEKRALLVIVAALLVGTGLRFLGKQRSAWAAAQDPMAVVNEAADLRADSGGRRIDINSAREYEFQTLPGIGPAIAARIVAYREKHGPFSAVEQVQRVSGIGPRRFDAIREHIVVGAGGP